MKNKTNEIIQIRSGKPSYYANEIFNTVYKYTPNKKIKIEVSSGLYLEIIDSSKYTMNPNSNVLTYGNIEIYFEINENLNGLTYSCLKEDTLLNEIITDIEIYTTNIRSWIKIDKSIIFVDFCNSRTYNYLCNIEEILSNFNIYDYDSKEFNILLDKVIILLRGVINEFKNKHIQKEINKYIEKINIQKERYTYENR